MALNISKTEYQGYDLTLVHLGPIYRMDTMKYILLTALLTLFFLSACQPANLPTSVGDQQPVTTSEPDGGKSLDTQRFTDALALAGATIEEEGEVEQPFFLGFGQV